MRKHIMIGLWGLCIASNASAQDTLPSYLKEVLVRNPRLHALKASHAYALEKKKEAGAWPDPRLSAGYFLAPIETRVGPQRFQLSLMQGFYWPGVLRARQAVQAKKAAAEQQRYEALKNALFFQAKETYYALYENNVLQALCTQQIALLAALERRHEQGVRGKRESAAVALAQQRQRSDKEQQLEALREEEQVLQARFNGLRYRPVESPVRLPATLSAVDPLPQKKRFVERVLKENPQLARLVEEERMSAAMQQVARKESFPSFDLGLRYYGIGKREVVSDGGRDALMPSVSLRVPVYRSRSKQRQAQWQLDAKKAQVRSHTQDLRTRMAAMWVALEKAQRETAFYRKEQERNAQHIRLSEEGYRAGHNTFTEILGLRMYMLEDEVQYTKAFVKQHVVTAHLLSLLKTNL